MEQKKRDAAARAISDGNYEVTKRSASSSSKRKPTLDVELEDAGAGTMIDTPTVRVASLSN